MSDGYYQDVDDAMDDYRWMDDKKPVKKSVKTRTECGYYDPKYLDIHDKIMAVNPNRVIGGKTYRGAYCVERDKIHAERARNFNAEKLEWENSSPTNSKIFVKCKNCGGGFEAKKADRKRGWAKFCTKSCAAQHR